MITRWMAIVAGVGLVCALAACEKAQTANPRKSDVPAWQGSTADKTYSAGGWKAGDQASWESQIRNRAQGQNEYSRSTAP